MDNVASASASQIPGASTLLAQLLEHSPVGVVAYDTSLSLLLWNPIMEQLTGLSAAAVIGKHLLETFPFLAESGEDERIRASLEGAFTSSRDSPFLIAESARKGFYDARYAPLRDRDNTIVGGIAFIRDATERREAELRMEESETRFRIMADCAPVMLWMSGTDSECDFFNQGWLRFSGRTLEQELGTGWAEGVHHEDLQACMDIYLESFNRRQPFRTEYKLRRADGQYRWILDQGTPRYSADGRFAGYIGSCIDVHDFKQAQEALVRARDELEVRVQQRTAELARSNRELEQFAYVASHDLQEPLRTVGNFVELLSRRYSGTLGTEADEFIAFALEGVARMRGLIGDLLAYSRVGEGEHPQPTECTEVLRLALANLQSLIEHEQAEVTYESLPRLIADPSQLLRVFQNLLSNAIKFHGDSAPRVHVSAQRRDAQWILAFRDHGIGIDPNYGGRLFTLFQRLHGRHEYSGSGIGLAICKKIVERHGGGIWFESEPGRGSTFFVSLPAAGEEPRSPAPEAPHAQT